MIKTLAVVAVIFAGAAQALAQEGRDGLTVPEAFQTLYLMLIYVADDAPAMSEEARGEAMLGHIYYQRRLQRDGVGLGAGGLVGAGDPALRGMTLLVAKSRNEAEAIAAADPMVKAGQFRVQIVDWIIPADTSIKGTPYAPEG